MFNFMYILAGLLAVVVFLIVSPRIRASFLSVLSSTSGKSEKSRVVCKYIVLLSSVALLLVTPAMLIFAYDTQSMSDLGRVNSFFNISPSFIDLLFTALPAMAIFVVVMGVLFYAQFNEQFSSDNNLKEPIDYDVISTGVSMTGAMLMSGFLLLMFLLSSTISSKSQSLYELYSFEGDVANITNIHGVLIDSCAGSHELGTLALNISSTSYTLFCGLALDADNNATVVFRDGELKTVTDDLGKKSSAISKYGLGNDKIIFSLDEDSSKVALAHFSPYFSMLGSVDKTNEAFALLDDEIDGHRSEIKASTLNALELQSFKIK
ncbi:membrane hypothetical protein [Vibrio chagasii]|nr:membrane hypothetical protein [Vibrio chagasii]